MEGRAHGHNFEKETSKDYPRPLRFNLVSVEKISI
jgi:hypothetical protein